MIAVACPCTSSGTTISVIFRPNTSSAVQPYISVANAFQNMICPSGYVAMTAARIFASSPVSTDMGFSAAFRDNTAGFFPVFLLISVLGFLFQILAYGRVLAWDEQNTLKSVYPTIRLIPVFLRLCVRRCSSAGLLHRRLHIPVELRSLPAFRRAYLPRLQSCRAAKIRTHHLGPVEFHVSQ